MSSQVPNILLYELVPPFLSQVPNILLYELVPPFLSWSIISYSILLDEQVFGH